jgi:hypothetical protein
MGVGGPIVEAGVLVAAGCVAAVGVAGFAGAFAAGCAGVGAGWLVLPAGAAAGVAAALLGGGGAARRCANPGATQHRERSDIDTVVARKVMKLSVWKFINGNRIVRLPLAY